MTYLPWVAWYSMAQSFIELHKPFCHDKNVIQEKKYIIIYFIYHEKI